MKVLRVRPTAVPVTDHVPLMERLRYMQILRLVITAAVVALAVAVPGLVVVDVRKLLPWSGAYLGAAVLTELFWRTRSRHRARAFGVMLMVDGAYLAWVAYQSGSTLSPFRYLLVLHLVAATLLGSYRTGLKLALWDSLLLLGVHNAVESGALPAVGGAPAGSPVSELQRLLVFVVAFWLIAMGTALFSAINERELRRRRRDLEALTRFAEALETADGPRRVAELLLEHLSPQGFRRGIVLGAQDGSLPCLHRYGGPAPASPPRPGPSLVIETAREARGSHLVRALDPHDDAYLSELLPEARNLLVVPLLGEGRPVGALVLESDRQRRTLERRVVAIVERFASHTALALRNAWLLETITRVAATDGLTKIANRRTFELTMEREVSRAARNREPVSLVMVDIDYFKLLNDTHGHQVGDEVLRNVAAALACECRDFDTVARYGGEEFAVVLPQCSPAEASRIAERLRAAVALAPNSVAVTASAGVATFPEHGHDPETLLKAADDALYESKRNGRNRLTAAGHVPAAPPSLPVDPRREDKPAEGVPLAVDALVPAQPAAADAPAVAATPS